MVKAELLTAEMADEIFETWEREGELWDRDFEDIAEREAEEQATLRWIEMMESAEYMRIYSRGY